jgi:hypothetical protein
VAELLSHPAEAGLLGARARATVEERFGVSRAAAAWLAAYGEATATL